MTGAEASSRPVGSTDDGVVSFCPSIIPLEPGEYTHQSAPPVNSSGGEPLVTAVIITTDSATSLETRLVGAGMTFNGGVVTDFLELVVQEARIGPGCTITVLQPWYCDTISDEYLDVAQKYIFNQSTPFEFEEIAHWLSIL